MRKEVDRMIQSVRVRFAVVKVRADRNERQLLEKRTSEGEVVGVGRLEHL